MVVDSHRVYMAVTLTAQARRHHGLTLMTQAGKKETVALRLAQYPGTTGG